MRALRVPTPSATIAAADSLLHHITHHHGSTAYAHHPPSSHFINRHHSSLHNMQPVPSFNRYNSNTNNGNSNGNGTNGGGSSDLFLFLHQIGTTPKEARFWLKEFQRGAQDLKRPFGTIQIDREVLLDEKLRSDLFESLAFIHRNGMKCVLIHGSHLDPDHYVTTEDLQILRGLLAQDSQVLVSGLESQNTPARLIYAGFDVLNVQQHHSEGLRGHVTDIRSAMIQDALDSGHIPIIQGLGVTDTGQMLALDVNHVTTQVARMLQPLKVMLVNTAGGLTNEFDEVVANINIPEDLEVLETREWYTTENRKQVHHVANLLQSLPRESSVVLTAASKILTELFSHHGSGTFFRIPECMHRYSSLDGIDIEKLHELINKSFAKDLSVSYFEEIAPRIDRVYVSEEYNAVAIITREEGLSIPYLDKFAVTLTKQGHGQGEMLWNAIKKDYKQLFWRSRFENRINSWYFQKSSSFIRQSSGSWSNGSWMVFWFGVEDHTESSKIIDFCLEKPSNFTN